MRGSMFSSKKLRINKVDERSTKDFEISKSSGEPFFKLFSKESLVLVPPLACFAMVPMILAQSAT